MRNYSLLPYISLSFPTIYTIVHNCTQMYTIIHIFRRNFLCLIPDYTLENPPVVQYLYSGLVIMKVTMRNLCQPDKPQNY